MWTTSYYLEMYTHAKYMALYRHTPQTPFKWYYSDTPGIVFFFLSTLFTYNYSGTLQEMGFIQELSVDSCRLFLDLHHFCSGFKMGEDFSYM